MRHGYKSKHTSLRLSCKIFEHFALQAGSSNCVHKLGSTPFKDGATLAPKPFDPLFFWRSAPPPLKYWIKYSWSRSTHILYYVKMLVRWNTLLRNQISSCQQVFDYTTSRRYVAVALGWNTCFIIPKLRVQAQVLPVALGRIK